MKKIIRYTLGVTLVLFQHVYAQNTKEDIWEFGGNSETNASTHFMGTTDRQSLVFKTVGSEVMRLGVDGKMGIGTRNFSTCTDCNQYRLFVKDGIKTETLKVAIASTAGWADHVFEKDYPLLELKEVERHILERGHLPNIPSAEEVVNKGINLGEMDAKLLEKIEELTLHLIDLNKKNKSLVRQNLMLDHTISLQDQEIDKMIERVDMLEKKYNRYE